METLSAIYESKQADVYLLKTLTLFLNLLTKWMFQLFELNVNGMGSAIWWCFSLEESFLVKVHSDSASVSAPRLRAGSIALKSCLGCIPNTKKSF